MGGPIRVLMVDDNRAACTLLRSFLDLTAGLEVCGEGHDGWEGLEALYKEQPDLVLLDLVMPGLDGIGFLHALQDNPPPKRPKIIVLSGICSDDYVQRACRLGADYYIVKPVKLDELAARIFALFSLSTGSEGLEAWALSSLGASKTCLGFRYACYGLGLFPAGEEPPQLKEIYLCVAKEFNTSYSRVEKNLRTLIRQIHVAGTELYRERMGFGNQEKPPDNGTFLRRLAETLAHRGE